VTKHHAKKIPPDKTSRLKRNDRRDRYTGPLLTILNVIN